MKLYHLYFGNPEQHYYSSNKDEILQIAHNQLIYNLRSIAQSLPTLTISFRQELVKCYIELKNNNIEEAIKIFSNIRSYHYSLKYSVEEPLSINNLPKQTIKDLDDEVKKAIFK